MSDFYGKSYRFGMPFALLFWLDEPKKGDLAMKTEPLDKKLARLEMIHDQLLAEYESLDELLRIIGFPKGIQSFQEAAVDLLNEIEEEEE